MWVKSSLQPNKIISYSFYFCNVVKYRIFFFSVAWKT